MQHLEYSSKRSQSRTSCLIMMTYEQHVNTKRWTRLKDKLNSRTNQLHENTNPNKRTSKTALP